MPSTISEIISVLGSPLSQLTEFTDESVISSRSNCSIAWMQLGNPRSEDQSIILSDENPPVVVAANQYGTFIENVITGESSVWKYFLKSSGVKNVALSMQVMQEYY